MKVKKLKMALLAFIVAVSTNAFADNVSINGTFDLKYDQFTEVNGKSQYSMNGLEGNIFGAGDWKQSTSDNPANNRNTYRGTLGLRLGAEVKNVKLNVGFCAMPDEFLGRINGTEISQGQRYGNVRDNSPVIVSDMSLEVNTDFGKITATNSFNYSFNPRVLFMQLDDNWGALNPYGEGILIEKELIKGLETKGFVFQATNKLVTYKKDDQNGQPLFTDGLKEWKADKLIYGGDVKIKSEKSKVGLLLINEHDKKTDERGTEFGKEKDILRYAINAEVSPINEFTLRGEFLRAIYGKDVTEIMQQPSFGWGEPGNITVDKDGKKDSNGYEVGITLKPINDIVLNAKYVNIGEDYVGVLGATKRRDSWEGPKTFYYNDGTGYDEGYSGDLTIKIPVMLTPALKGSYSDLKKTRSHMNKEEDNREIEWKLATDFGDGPWKADVYYRNKKLKNNSSKLDTEFNDAGINGKYTIYKDKTINVQAKGNVNMYTGDNKILDKDKRFSNELKFGTGVSSDYKFNEKTSLFASYYITAARENNDIVKNSYGIQNLIKTGMNYKINDTSNLSLLYKFDTYKLDRKVTVDELNKTEAKKEADHIWYDGHESWETRQAFYEGYTTHEVKLTISVGF